MWLNDIKPKGGMLDGLRAGRRKLNGSDNFPPNKPQTEDALHKCVGRFSYAGISTADIREVMCSYKWKYSLNDIEVYRCR